MLDVTVQISEEAERRCSRASAQKFTNDLLNILYTDTYMACHTLGGKSSKESSKAGLPADDILTIIGK
jgi:hypothetical protein